MMLITGESSGLGFEFTFKKKESENYSSTGRVPQACRWVTALAAICFASEVEVILFKYTAYRQKYHIVRITKYRRPILNPGVQLYLRKFFPQVMQSLPGYEKVEYSLQVDPLFI